MTVSIYTQQFRILSLVLVSFFFSLYSGFSNDPCLIRTDIEPDIIQQNFAPTLISVSDISGLSTWLNSENAAGLDGELSSIHLAPGEKSNKLVFNEFYFDIPLGARIAGIQFEITGASSNREYLDEKQMQFFLDGSPIGNNLADKSVISEPWDEELHTWNYGYEFTDWNMNPSYELLNENGLSFALQVENDSDSDSLEVLIDHASIIVYYEPLYSVCGHECVAIYNDEVDGALEYNWTFPEHVNVINSNENNRILNLDFTQADIGLLEVDLEIIRSTDTLYCSRTFLKEDCSPASIGDYVWFDSDFDGLQDAEEEGLSGVVLNLYTPLQELISSTTSVGDGYYQFANLERGYYYIEIETSDYITTIITNNDSLNSDFNSNFISDVFYVSGGDSILNIDAGLFASSSISGVIWTECDGNGIQGDDEETLENIEVELYKGNDFLGNTFTDENGLYLFENLSSGEHTVVLIGQENMSPEGGDNVFNEDNEVTVDLGIGEDIEGIDGAINPLATYEFTIFIDDNDNGTYESGEDKLEGKEIVIKRGDTPFGGIIENGKATFTDLLPGNYFLEIENPEEYTVESSDFAFSSGETLIFILGNPLCETVNSVQLILSDYSATVGNYIWHDKNGNGLQDDDESGIPNAKVQLINFTTADVEMETESDENGLYTFENPPESNYLIFVFPGIEFSETEKDVDPEKGSKVVFVTDRFVMGPIDVSNGYNDDTWDAGFIMEPGTISGTAWIDKKEDDKLSDSDILLEEVGVNLFTSAGDFVSTEITNDQGFYSFDVTPGSYYIEFSHSIYSKVVEYQVGGDPLFDSDVIPGGEIETEIFEVGSAENVEGINVGYKKLEQAKVGDLVFMDSNENGLFDDNEQGLKNFTIKAFDLNGDLVAQTFSQVGGYYELSLDPGTYYLEFTKQGFDEATLYNSTNDEKNSDITGDFGPFTTSLITVEAGTFNTDIDAGFLKVTAIIGDLVWNDINANAFQEFDELGIKDMKVNLVRVGEGVVMSTTTGNGQDTFPGLYHFEVDVPGEYYVQFEIEDDGYTFTQYEPQGSSDVTSDNGFGTTPTFEVELGELYKTKDAGVVSLYSILGNFVWEDENGNGLQDSNEKGINGINVFLYDDAFNFLDVTVTTYNPLSKADGYYHFEELGEGNYILVFDSSEDFTTSIAGSDFTIDSDVTSEFVMGSTGIIHLEEGEKAFHIDAGVFNDDSNGFSTIGDFVWNDLNKNGIQDSGENGLKDISINLVNDYGQIFQTVESNDEGYYEFKYVPKGYYRINVPTVSDFEFTIPNNSFDDVTDSDVQSDGNTLLFYVEANQEITHIDIGMNETDGIVWENEEDLIDENIEEIETGINEEDLIKGELNNSFSDEEIIDESSSNGNINIGKQALQVYPIPARDVLNLRINVDLKGEAKIEIINGEGEIMRTMKRENKRNMNHQLDILELRAGFYFIRVTDGKEVYFKKFIIQ